MDKRFLGLDLENWIKVTIKKVQSGTSWNQSWIKAYSELNGISKSSGNKSCPKNAARVLYETGRIKDSDKTYVDISLTDIWEYDSKNGVYALLAIDVLHRKPDIIYQDLVRLVHNKSKRMFGVAPVSDQGAIRITFKLWHIGLIVNRPHNQQVTYGVQTNGIRTTFP